MAQLSPILEIVQFSREVRSLLQCSVLCTLQCMSSPNTETADSSQVAAPTRLVFTYTAWHGWDDLRSINLVNIFLFWMPLYIDAKGRKGFIRSLSFHTHGFDASEDSIELEWEELGELLVAGQLFKIVLFTSGMEWRDKGKYCIFLTSWNFICYNHWARTSEEWPCQVVHQELLADYWQTQDIGSDHWSNGRRVKYKIKRLYRYILGGYISHSGHKCSKLWNTRRIKKYFVIEIRILSSRVIQCWKYFVFDKQSSGKWCSLAPVSHTASQCQAERSRAKHSCARALFFVHAINNSL